MSLSSRICNNRTDISADHVLNWRQTRLLCHLAHRPIVTIKLIGFMPLQWTRKGENNCFLTATYVTIWMSNISILMICTHENRRRPPSWCFFPLLLSLPASSTGHLPPADAIIIQLPIFKSSFREENVEIAGCTFEQGWDYDEYRLDAVVYEIGCQVTGENFGSALFNSDVTSWIKSTCWKQTMSKSEISWEAPFALWLEPPVVF